MSDPSFDIIFRGDIVPGHNIQEVKIKLGQLFKIDAAKVEALFAGGAVVLKRKVDQTTAEKYKTALTKAGAQVALRPSVAPASQPVVKPRAVGQGDPERPQAGPAEPAQAQQRFTLAPVGADLLNPSLNRKGDTAELDLSGYSVRPMEGNLIDESEKPLVIPVAVSDPGFDLAPPGCDLLEGFASETNDVAEVDPDFEIAEVGVELLKPEERPQKKAVIVSTDHLSVAPLDEF